MDAYSFLIRNSAPIEKIPKMCVDAIQHFSYLTQRNGLKII